MRGAASPPSPSLRRAHVAARVARRRVPRRKHAGAQALRRAHRPRLAALRKRPHTHPPLVAQANNGKERKDLYSDNWDGDVYKGASRVARPFAHLPPPHDTLCRKRAHSSMPAGSGFNILTLVVTAFVLTPVLGLAFAYWSYGTLWG